MTPEESAQQRERERYALVKANWVAMKAAGWTLAWPLTSAECPLCFAFVSQDHWRDHEAWHHVEAFVSSSPPEATSNDYPPPPPPTVEPETVKLA